MEMSIGGYFIKHTRDRGGRIIVFELKDLADRVFIAKIFFCDRAGDDNIVGGHQDSIRIALDQRDGKHMKEIAVDKGDGVFLKGLCPVADTGSAIVTDAGGLFYFGEISLE